MNPTDIKQKENCKIKVTFKTLFNMNKNSNFYGSLTRDRKDVSKAIAKDLALNAYEEWQDQVRALDKSIREIKLQLNSMRDSAYTDPLLVALKKNQPIDVKNELVARRTNLLLDLKEAIEARDIVARDRFFAIPAEEFVDGDNELDDILSGRNDDDEVAATGEAE